MSSPHRLVVIGNGMAGVRLVEDVLARRGARAFDIVVFGEEPHGTYNRILLSGVLAGTHRQCDIVTHPRSWYEENGVTLRAGVRVERIDLAARTVFDGNGASETYDTLVFATGSVPVLPPIDGLTSDTGELIRGAFVFRTVADCERMIEEAQHGAAAVVIGGGLLGLEAARGLAGRGLDVSVVHLTSHVMDAQLDPDGSGVLRRQLEMMGLRVLTGRTTAAILGDGRVEGVRFADGTTIPCGMVVVAAGIRPRSGLAERAGLAVRRGILVHDDLSCPGHQNVCAIGECAEHRGQVYGLVAPAWEQADVLADRISGRSPQARYHGSRLTTKLKVAGLDVAVMGERVAPEDGEIVSYAELSRGIYKKLFVRDNRLVGAILIGGGAVVPAVSQAFLESVPLPARRSDLLFPPAIDAAPRSVDQIPDDTRICDCNAVSKSQIVEAMLSGAVSLRAVSDKTRAGTGCGSCRPEVQRIIEFVAKGIDGTQGLPTSRETEEAPSAGYAAS
jgi:nitrite reductase (NADH) large subunit